MKTVAVSSILALLTTLVIVGSNVALADDKYVASPIDEQILGTWKTGYFADGNYVTLTIRPHEEKNRFNYDIEINWGLSITRTSSEWSGGRVELKNDGTILYKGKKCLVAELRLTKDLQSLEGPYYSRCSRKSGTWKLVKQN